MNQLLQEENELLKIAMADLYVATFHPEFGTAWAEDGECAKAYKLGFEAAMQQIGIVKKPMPIDNPFNIKPKR